MAEPLLREPPTRRLLDLAAYVWIRSKRFVRQLAHQKATTHQIALGCALGAFIAFTPTFGFQMILGFAAATALRCSRFGCIVFTYITNPFTVVPIYLFTYKAGAWMLGQKPLSHEARRVLLRLADEGWAAGLRQLLRFGSDLIVPLWLGGVIVGFIAAGIVYPLMLRLVEGHRQLAARKRELRAQRRAERLRIAAGLATSGDPAPIDARAPQDLPPPNEDHPVETDAS